MEQPTLSEHIGHDCVDGLPPTNIFDQLAALATPPAMDFADTLRAHDEFEFDDALADGLVPEHEVMQRRPAL